MKIWKMTECDWVAAETFEDAKQPIVEMMGEDAADFLEEAEPEPLSDSELDGLMFVDGDLDDEDSKPVRRSFRDQLAIEIAAGGKFPRIFASTEY